MLSRHASLPFNESSKAESGGAQLKAGATASIQCSSSILGCSAVTACVHGAVYSKCQDIMHVVLADDNSAAIFLSGWRALLCKCICIEAQAVNCCQKMPLQFFFLFWNVLF